MLHHAAQKQCGCTAACCCCADMPTAAAVPVDAALSCQWVILHVTDFYTANGYEVVLSYAVTVCKQAYITAPLCIRTPDTNNAHMLLMMMLLCAAAVFVLLVAWPTWAHASYQQWRIPVLSFTRIYLVALPFNFSTSVFDAIAPQAGTGRFALVSNVFQLFLGERRQQQQQQQHPRGQQQH
jgi:hypothetical protein